MSKHKVRILSDRGFKPEFMPIWRKKILWVWIMKAYVQTDRDRRKTTRGPQTARGPRVWDHFFVRLSSPLNNYGRFFPSIWIPKNLSNVLFKFFFFSTLKDKIKYFEEKQLSWIFSSRVIYLFYQSISFKGKKQNLPHLQRYRIKLEWAISPPKVNVLPLFLSDSWHHLLD